MTPVIQIRFKPAFHFAIDELFVEQAEKQLRRSDVPYDQLLCLNLGAVSQLNAFGLAIFHKNFVDICVDEVFHSQFLTG